VSPRVSNAIRFPAPVVGRELIDRDRIADVPSRFLKWRQLLTIVKPETLIR
jgi:hypothetical protein